MSNIISIIGSSLVTTPFPIMGKSSSVVQEYELTLTGKVLNRSMFPISSLVTEIKLKLMSDSVSKLIVKTVVLPPLLPTVELISNFSLTILTSVHAFNN